MKRKENQIKGEKIFENNESKSLFKKGVKYLVIALPLLFISPIIITIGFKSLHKSQNYLVLILGCLLAIFTIVLMVQSFRIFIKALFSK